MCECCALGSMFIKPFVCVLYIKVRACAMQVYASDLTVWYIGFELRLTGNELSMWSDDQGLRVDDQPDGLYTFFGTHGLQCSTD